MKVKEAIEIINGADNLYNLHEAEQLIKGDVVAYHQDEEDHTYYMESTRVFQVEDGCVGVRGPYKRYYEEDDWHDIADASGGVYAFEVEPVPTVYYKRKHYTPVILWLEDMKPFSVNFIPEPPILEKKLYNKYVIPNFIRCGAIPKDKLTVGKTYYGNCRNADRAIWTGDCFEYERIKFGHTYTEKIGHFEDGGGSSTDVFVPIKEL